MSSNIPPPLPPPPSTSALDTAGKKIALLLSLSIPPIITSVAAAAFQLRLDPLPDWSEPLVYVLIIIPSLLGGGIAYLFPARGGKGATFKREMWALLLSAASATILGICYSDYSDRPSTNLFFDVRGHRYYFAVCYLLYGAFYLFLCYFLVRLALLGRRLKEQPADKTTGQA